ncbi:hypothetical protein [Azospirillum halopraeferens]|uniref:hypothetical protein n=1 Tax=Azospirillum halopraeferens TaxID=34010 RepID=UPI0024802407|nr:hypothetical protein [Azospirillum halopraeferens]
MTVASGLTLAVLAVPSPGRTEAPPVAQLGDHAGFSRLVVRVPDGAMPVAVPGACTVRLERDTATDWPLETLTAAHASRLSGFEILDDGRTLAAAIPCGARVTAIRERRLLIVDVAEPPVPGRKPRPLTRPAWESQVVALSPAPAAPVLLHAEPPAPAPAPAPVPAPETADLAAAIRADVERAARQLDTVPEAAPAPSPPSPSAPPPAPPPAAVAPPADPPIGPMDLAAWAGEDFAATRATLQAAMADATGRARADAFIAMARFALARALAEEGRATLEAAAALDPAPDQRYALRVLDDAFRALGRTADPEASLFVRIAPGTAPDHQVWRSATLAPTRWAAAREGLPIALKRLLDYPPDLRSRLLTLLAEAADGARDSDSLNLIVLGMITVDGPGAADGHLDYFRGRLAELRDTPAAAIDHYARAAAGRDGPYARRAEVRAVDLRRRTGALDDDGTIAELEALRFGWRGDAVEIDALAALGSAYARSGRTDSALDTFGLLGRRFGSTAAGRDALAAGRDLLSVVLDRLEREEPGGLHALALQARHGRLVAMADDGDATLRRRLADALARDGFTLEASRILRALTEEAEGPRRSALGAALARTLIDTGHGAEALEALHRTGTTDLDADLAVRRTLLRAEALIDLGETVRALDALNGVPGPEAARLRARSLFDTGEWAAARAAYAALVGEGGTPAAADVALLGLSAHLAGDDAAVRDLAARHGARLEGTRWSGLLDALAPPAAPTGRPIGAEEVARQLAAAAALDRLAGRWRLTAEP